MLGVQGDVFKRFDSVTYVGYTPGKSGLWVSQADHRLRTRIHINSAGYRGPELPEGAEPEIAFLGDSFTAAMQVPYDRCFVALTQTQLRRVAPRAACLNFGIDGTGTGIQLAHLRANILPRRPTVVVLQFTIGNDFADNASLLNWKPYYPSWELEDGRLVVRPPAVEPPRFMDLARFSRAAGWLFTIYRHLARPIREPRCEDRWLYRIDAESLQHQVFDVTGQLLLELVEETRRSGALLVIMIVPTPCQVDTGWATGTESLDPELPNVYLSSKLGARAIVVDLLQPFRDEATRRHDPGWYRFELDGHFNEAGHRFVAHVLATTLLKVVDAERYEAPSRTPEPASLSPHDR